MKEQVYSQCMKKYYCPADCIRIVNGLQAATYWINGCIPEDIYSSRDVRTNKPVIVYVFDRDKSKPFYDLWQKYELK